ncbi:DUF222 domain-containing protein [Modestobacter sp. I12A-02628]|uniref:DUF222 domain-containing protein n=1 Tax=Goekera deserti TaxID=2497753 RepID=A0A7K3WL90_9ACTN|nr:HNH endonuclease signature motif containing protein [Goekera deserti]MPQ98958.1 DUF222 domain-containing protein [Goekera deserti]NDI49542.1 DUF222 domain-containing protein [Goekera deserti]NEL56649.1 DUF222 domain-containing protein [Goekera deserti]
MSEIRSAIDALTTDDLHELTDGAVLERCTELVQLLNRVGAELTRTVHHADATGAAQYDGMRTMASWLRGHAHYSTAAASSLVKAGRALDHLPAVAAAYADGHVTAAQVTVIADTVTPARLTRAAEQHIDMGPFDQAWAVIAATRPHDVLTTAVTAFTHALDPDGPEPDPTDGRRLSMSTHGDGSVSGRFELDAVGGEKVKAALESIQQANRPAGDTRTRSQQQGDALVQLADNQLASGHLPVLRSHKPQVVVTIDLDDLVEPTTGHGAARTGFGAVISAARARWLACDAQITRIVLSPDGLPLDVGRTHRIVPPHIRRAVEHRDQHCIFAGCTAPTHWCEVHHLLEWALHDGETSLDNSALLCERHHAQVHHGYRIHRDDTAPPGHRWHTYRPDGTEIHIGPPVT